MSAKPCGVASVAQARRAKPIERGTSSGIWSIVESHAHVFANGASDQSSRIGPARTGPASYHLPQYQAWGRKTLFGEDVTSVMSIPGRTFISPRFFTP